MGTTNTEKHPALTRDQIRQAALALPLEEREELLSEILGSIEENREEIDQSWLAEVKRRIAAYERGETQLIDHDEVMRQVDEDLAEMDAKVLP